MAEKRDITAREITYVVPRSFRVGGGSKVHVGTHRRDEIIVLACGMAGVVGSDWLIPTEDRYEEVTCGHCLRAVNRGR